MSWTLNSPHVSSEIVRSSPLLEMLESGRTSVTSEKMLLSALNACRLRLFLYVEIMRARIASELRSFANNCSTREFDCCKEGINWTKQIIPTRNIERRYMLRDSVECCQP